jgi:restriction endonuclease Mrr
MNIAFKVVTCNVDLRCVLCEKPIPACAMFWTFAEISTKRPWAICKDHISINQTGVSYTEDSNIIYVTEHVHARDALVPRLLCDWESVFSLTPDEFEQLVYDRMLLMGMQAYRTGKTNQRDGGIDILFWTTGPMPVKGAVQVKHHRSSRKKTDYGAVRDFEGAIAGKKLNLGWIVTNTAFTRTAREFASKSAAGIQLRDGSDVQRWLSGQFTIEARHIGQDTLDMCGGVTFDLPDFL